MTERGARVRAGALIGALLLSASGCYFSRSVINERVRELDPAQIRVGRSTVFDVLALLGAPPPTTTQEVGTLAMAGPFANYRTTEQRCVILGLRYYVVAPFTWCYVDDAYEIAVEYDERYVVKRVDVVERDMIWRPFEDQRDLAPPRNRSLTRVDRGGE